MTVHLIPHLASPGSVELWVGSFDENLDGRILELRHDAAVRNVDFGPTRGVRSRNGGRLVQYRRATIDGLAPSTTHRFEVNAASRSLASTQFDTAPATLRSGPLTVMLSSCYHIDNDPNRLVAATVADLRNNRTIRPHLQVFCGDQIYADGDVLLAVDNIEERMREAYRRTWGPAGLGDVLSRGVNVFAADDHEFWNNSPRYAPLIPDTCATDHRFEMASVARRFFEAVQSRQVVRSFEMAGVPFFVADTRVRRTHDLRRFLPRGAFGRLQRWLRGLDAPGVLIIGQPVIEAARSRLESTVVDASLTSFDQYAALADALQTAPHDILVLSGDVHFGRVASVALTSGRTLVEVISSPLALVSPTVASAPPTPFPWPSGAPGGSTFTDVRSVSTIPGGTPLSGNIETREHLMTLEIDRSRTGLTVEITAWRLGSGTAVADFTQSVNLS